MFGKSDHICIKYVDIIPNVYPVDLRTLFYGVIRDYSDLSGYGLNSFLEYFKIPAKIDLKDTQRPDISSY